MKLVKCPNCKKKNFYFDSPTLFKLHLIYSAGVFYVMDVEKEKRVKKMVDRVTVFMSEVADENWGWTCKNCDEIITSDMKEWRQLKRQALKYLGE